MELLLEQYAILMREVMGRIQESDSELCISEFQAVLLLPTLSASKCPLACVHLAYLHFVFLFSFFVERKEKKEKKALNVAQKHSGVVQFCSQKPFNFLELFSNFSTGGTLVMCNIEVESLSSVNSRNFHPSFAL